MSNHQGIAVSKQQVLDLLEPHVPLERIDTDYDTTFNMFKFGSFEIDCDRYVFGTEEHQYHATMRSHSKRSEVFPVVIAKVNEPFGKDPSYKMVPAGTFTDQELELIEEMIHYTFSVQFAASHYYQTRC